MKLIILLFLSLCNSVCFSQKLVFHHKLKVFINSKANPDFQVRFINLENDTIMKQDIKTYQPGDVLYTYQLVKKPDWKKGKALNADSTTLPDLLTKKTELYADIKPDEDRLMVYFWPFRTKDSLSIKANGFFEKNSFSIELKDRVNLSFWSTECISGVLTLPVKIYVGGPDSVSAVQAAVSTGIYLGKKWGRTKFVKLPNEKEFTTYQSSWSWNGFVGLNKLDLDEKNTKDAGKKFKGSIASLSLGTAAGFHYKTLTAFLALGFDIPLSNKGSNWSLKGKPWLGFGAGFEIF